MIRTSRWNVATRMAILLPQPTARRRPPLTHIPDAQYHGDVGSREAVSRRITGPIPRRQQLGPRRIARPLSHRDANLLFVGESFRRIRAGAPSSVRALQFQTVPESQSSVNSAA